MRARRPGGESKWLWIVTIVAVALGALAYLNRPDPPDESADDPTAAPSASAEPSATPTPRKRKKKAEATAEPVQLPSDLPMPPGLGGSGSGKSLPRTAYQIRITSTKPLYRVQYIIPTSDKKQYGEDNGVGSTWAHDTTVWGRPDYGAAFVHALWPGVEVTCVVSVGGRVVERRTIVGPYGAMWCQG